MRATEGESGREWGANRAARADILRVTLHYKADVKYSRELARRHLGAAVAASAASTGWL